MSDRINITGLEIYSHIGVPDEERSRRQKLLVNLSLKVRSTAEAAAADNVALTVDYAQVANEIKEVATSHPRKLIETLAEDITVAVFRHELVREVSVEIEKFILPDTRSVSVAIKRKAPKKKKEKTPAPAPVVTAKNNPAKRLTKLRRVIRTKPQLPS